jgi:diamine N-acetyltransferase
MTEAAIPVTREANVTLREITEETVNAILKLRVAKEQENFVANNAVSLAQAHFSKHAWFRAIYANETPVGFILLFDNPAEPTYYLWRFMLDERFQRLGFGRKAIGLLVDYVKTRPNATELLLSYVPQEGGPKGFYESLGFVHTGKEHDGELEMRLVL